MGHPVLAADSYVKKDSFGNLTGHHQPRALSFIRVILVIIEIMTLTVQPFFHLVSYQHSYV